MTEVPVAHSESHEDAHGHDHHMGHVASKKVLFGTWGTLMVLTIVTVTASKVDFGAAELNLLIAMVIAIIKATLVCLFFMHLKFDKLFHSLLVVGAIVTAGLFVGYTLLDSNQYQSTIIWDPDSPPPAPYGPKPAP